MIEPISELAPQDLARFDDIIDVRSPGEFADDRIPGAINLPVLDDAERAEVGTIYVQQSRFLARRVGAAMVARNIARHLDGVLKDKQGAYRPLLYCWRGGMRSNAMATILSQIGWRVGVVQGGYKTWRRTVVEHLRKSDAPLNLVLLDGQTGVAKSQVLQHLARIGVQTIDLEKLAAHRGSAFGAHPARIQPGQKYFESELWRAIARLDVSRPTVVEAESARVGAIALPRRLWRAMSVAPHIVLMAEPGARAQFLVDAYADVIAAPGAVLAAIDRLAPFHAKSLIEDWRSLATSGAFGALAAALMREHYDPLYDRGRSRRANGAIGELALPRLDPPCFDAAAHAIKHLLNKGGTAG